MASPNTIFGRVKITVAGNVMGSKPGAELDAVSGERTAVMGEYGILGFTEKSKPVTVKFDVVAKNGVTQSSLYALVDDTVLWEGDNGNSCTLSQATTSKVSGIKSGDGGGFYTVEMFAIQSNETTS